MDPRCASRSPAALSNGSGSGTSGVSAEPVGRGKIDL